MLNVAICTALGWDPPGTPVPPFPFIGFCSIWQSIKTQWRPLKMSGPLGLLLLVSSNAESGISSTVSLRCFYSLLWSTVCCWLLPCSITCSSFLLSFRAQYVAWALMPLPAHFHPSFCLSVLLPHTYQSFAIHHFTICTLTSLANKQLN